jgi:hypothetical protein
VELHNRIEPVYAICLPWNLGKDLWRINYTKYSNHSGQAKSYILSPRKDVAKV